jgi:redox-regulated HSP33 family molecular chaperone
MSVNKNWCDIEDEEELQDLLQRQLELSNKNPESIKISQDPTVEQKEVWFTIKGGKKVKAMVNELKSISIECNNCHKQFTFTEKQRAKYRSKNWKDPKICKSCCSKRYHTDSSDK